MKITFILLGVLYSMNSLASFACTAHYAAGMNYILNAESVICSDQNRVDI